MDGLSVVRRQGAAGWVLIGFGGLLFGVAAVGVRGSLFLADQLSYAMSGGVGGALAVLLGATLVVRGRLRLEWELLDEVEGLVRVVDGASVSWTAPSVTGWLWSQADRVAGWALVVVGAGLFGVAAPSVAGSLYVPDQVSRLVSGGVMAVVVVLIGAALLVLADLRDQLAKLARLAVVRGLPSDRPGLRAAVGPAVAGVVLGVALVAGSWRMASTTVRPEDAFSALALAAVGVGVVAVGVGLTGIWIRRVAAERITGLAESLVDDEVRPAAVEIDLGTEEPVFFSAAGLQRFHREFCPALRLTGADPHPVEPVDPRLRPCELCVAETLAGVN